MRTTVVFLLLFALSLSIVLSNETASGKASRFGHLYRKVLTRPSSTRRSPIEIEGEKDLDSNHGVVNPEAAGTSEDPYVIEGLTVHHRQGASAAIALRDVSSHVVLRNLDLAAATTGIELIRCRNVQVEDVRIHEIVGQFGSMGGGSGGPATGLYVEESSNVTIAGLTIETIYGGAGGAGILGTPEAGSGGDAYGIRLVDRTDSQARLENVEIIDAVVSDLKGGAGGAGAFSVKFQGNGGRGGHATGLSIEGPVVGLTIRSTNLSSLYGGAGGAGGVNSDKGGMGGRGGDATGVRLDGLCEQVAIDGLQISVLYGAASGIGAVPFLAGQPGITGRRGGHAVGVDVSQGVTNLSIINSTVSVLYGGAASAGATGVIGVNAGIVRIKGGDGGNGYEGGSAVGFLLKNPMNSTLVGNEISDLWGGAGSAGAAGAVPAGNGGSGGHGGWAVGISLVDADTVTVRGNTIRSLHGAAGAVGALGAMAQLIGELVSRAGMGGDGGSGGSAIGVRLQACRSTVVDENSVHSVFGGAGAMAGSGNAQHVLGIPSLSRGGSGGNGGDGLGVVTCGSSDITVGENDSSALGRGMGGLGAMLGGQAGSLGTSVAAIERRAPRADFVPLLLSGH